MRGVHCTQVPTIDVDKLRNEQKPVTIINTNPPLPPALDPYADCLLRWNEVMGVQRVELRLRAPIQRVRDKRTLVTRLIQEDIARALHIPVARVCVMGFNASPKIVNRVNVVVHVLPDPEDASLRPMALRRVAESQNRSGGLLPSWPVRAHHRRHSVVINSAQESLVSSFSSSSSSAADPSSDSVPMTFLTHDANTPTGLLTEPHTLATLPSSVTATPDSTLGAFVNVFSVSAPTVAAPVVTASDPVDASAATLFPAEPPQLGSFSSSSTDEPPTCAWRGSVALAAHPFESTSDAPLLRHASVFNSSRMTLTGTRRSALVLPKLSLIPQQPVKKKAIELIWPSQPTAWEATQTLTRAATRLSWRDGALAVLITRIHISPLHDQFDDLTTWMRARVVDVVTASLPATPETVEEEQLWLSPETKGDLHDTQPGQEQASPEPTQERDPDDGLAPMATPRRSSALPKVPYFKTRPSGLSFLLNTPDAKRLLTPAQQRLLRAAKIYNVDTDAVDESDEGMGSTAVAASLAATTITAMPDVSSFPSSTDVACASDHIIEPTHAVAPPATASVTATGSACDSKSSGAAVGLSQAASNPSWETRLPISPFFGAVTSPSISIDIRSTMSTPIATVPQFRASLDALLSVPPRFPESYTAAAAEVVEEPPQDHLRFFFPALDHECVSQ